MCAGVSAAGAQDASHAGPAAPSLPITPAWDTAAYQPHDAVLAFSLPRPLEPREGRIAIVIDRIDLSALAVTSNEHVRLPLRGTPLGAGAHDVEVWRIDPSGDWEAMGRFPLRRLTRSGFEQATARPRLDVQSDGQLDADPEGGSVGRGRTFQDVSATTGGEGTLRRRGWEVGWRGIVSGASHTPARLRAAQLGTRAPPLDLASYDVRLARGGFALGAGHISLGNHRLLASQFRSRGVAVDLALGDRLTIGVGTVAATEIVGWSDPFGMSRPSHRVASAMMALDVAPRRYGSLRVELSGLGGSSQPLPAFTGQAVNDRERSRGFGAQVTAADPSQRVRLTAGWARSRFGNPVDPALAGDSTLVPLRDEQRTGRFGELAIDVLRGARLGPAVAMLGVVVRHERIDPLYRSIAAFVQADRAQSVIEATGSVGALQWQAAGGRGRDNLDDVPSLLTTHSRTWSLSGALPLAALVGTSAEAWWWPAASVAWQGAAQRGGALPENGGFRDESQRPDQYAGSVQASLAWQAARWSLAYRHGRSIVDNRQPTRERADFVARTHGATLGWMASERLSAALDLGAESQRSVEDGAQSRIRRVGAQADWLPMMRTAIGASVSLVQTIDDATTQRGRDVEARLELSQAFNLWLRSPDDAQARAFVRWSRSGSALRLAGVRQPGVAQWTLNAGLGLRVF